MPTVKTISVSFPINASQRDVFDAVTTWELQSKWIFATKVRGVGNNSHKLGGRLEALTGFSKFGFLDTMTITRWDPPNACEVTHTGEVVKGSGLFRVHREDNVTYFTWIERTVIPFGWFGRLGWLFVAPLTKLGMSLSLRRFRKIVQSR